VVVGVIIILAGGFLTKPDGSKDVMNDQGTGQIPRGSLSDSEVVYCGAEVVADIEKRLSELLSLVEGAGQVSVMIYADSSSELIPAYNDALDNRSNQESDRASTESSERRELALSGDNTPVILKVVIPR
jgi:stage III sporulation protein AG